MFGSFGRGSNSYIDHLQTPQIVRMLSPIDIFLFFKIGVPEIQPLLEGHTDTGILIAVLIQGLIKLMSIV